MRAHGTTGVGEVERSAKVLRAALLALVAPLATGCGWHGGLVLPEAHRSVGVEVFDTARELHERNLEPILADALSRAVGDWVQAPLVPPGRADVVVRGEILDYRRRSGIRNRDNRLLETGLFLAVTARLVDRRTGRDVRGPTREHVWTGYVLGDDASAHEAQARDRSLQILAETLVLDLFGPAPSDGP